MKLINLISIACGIFMLGATNSNVAYVNNAAITQEEGTSECQAALDQTYLNIDTTQVVTDIRLPYKGIYSTSISWTSSNTSVISINTSTWIGKVTRPSENTDVTLTAKASLISGKETYTATKDYTVTVLKDSGSTAEELPLAFNEDFSSYLTDIDLSNYNKWQISKGDSGCVHVIHKDEFPNVNNMVSTAALEIVSQRVNSDSYYEANINLSSSTSASAVGVVEGFFLFTGDTNGVALELCSGSSVIAGIKISSDAYSFFKAGSYSAATSATPEEGVWEKFRLTVRTSGYMIFELYSWSEGKYIDITKDAGTTNYISGAGVSSGSKGNATKMRIHTFSGKKNGATYLSNIKLDSQENLPSTATVTNPNRTYGIGDISGYEPSILALKGETVAGVDPSKFIVKNRFDTTTTYTCNTDYSVKTATNSNDDGSVVTYTHTFTLLKTMEGVSENETKTIIQTVYFDTADNVATISGFKVSYLKASTTGKGQATISGNVIRNDSTFYYVVLPEGSAAPTANQIINASSLTGAIDYGNGTVSSSSFSLNTSDLDITGIYDIYGVTNNPNGNSEVCKAASVSTKVNISTCQDLYDVTFNKDTASSECVLINDIDFSNYEWSYDTTGSLKFAGTLDGQGHTISNLNFTTPVTTAKVGLFANLSGTVKNLTFKDADIAGYTDVGIITGNLYDKAVVQDVNFISCTVRQDSTVSGGDGYFGVIGGRVRSGADVTVKDINIKSSSIDSSQRTGMIVGGVGDSNDNASLTVKNVYVDGKITTDNGASVGGIVGRNRGSVTIDNAVVFLDVGNAKKEVAACVGKHEKGTLTVSNFVGDLKVEMITQTNYFNNFIGTVTPSQATYTASNVTFFNEDYSHLADTIAYNVNAIDLGNHVDKPETYTAEWWEKNTFIRDFGVSTIWKCDASTGLPEIYIRSSSSISFTAKDFTDLVAKIDTSKVMANHYYIYKALDVYNYLSATDKASVTTEYAKLVKAQKDYNDAITNIGTINSATSGLIGQ